MTLTNGNSYAYQWDVGLAVATEDDVGTERRFANKHGNKSIPVLATQDGDNVVYKIPNILLTTGRDIVMYSLDGEGETTEHIVAMDELIVYEAQKPDDYVWTDAELRIWDSKINEPYIEGADGDVLRTDGEGGRYWGKVDYSEVENTPYIPEKTSDITNDSGYITAEDLPPNGSLFVTFSQASSTDPITADASWSDVRAAVIAEVPIFGLFKSTYYYYSGVGDSLGWAFRADDVFTDTGDAFTILTRTLTLPLSGACTYSEQTRTVNDYNQLANRPIINNVVLASQLSGDDLGLINKPANPSNGNVLTWDGSKWSAAAPSGGSATFYIIEMESQIPVDDADTLRAALAAGQILAVHSNGSIKIVDVIQDDDESFEFGVTWWQDMGVSPTVTAAVRRYWSWDDTDADPEWSYSTETAYNSTYRTHTHTLSDISNVFICEYNVTNFSDVASAYSAGKSIYCKTGATIIPLTHIVGSTPTEYRFAYMHSSNGSTVYRLTSSGWADAGATLTPTTRTINGHALSADITLDFDDLGDIFIATYNSTLFADVLAAYNAGKSIYVKAALDGLNNEPYPLTSMSTNGTDITRFNFTIPKGTVYTEPYVSSSGWSYNTGSFVPQTRTVNNKALSSNISLDADDVGAIAAPSSPTTGDFLVWNGSAWAATSLSTWQGGSY